jgi:regulator of sirC expression with transglutaminase-like and TPR domain
MTQGAFMMDSAHQLPICCSPVAYDALAAQMNALETPQGLVRAAVAISTHQMRDADVAAVEPVLQDYADWVRARVRGVQPQALLAHAHDLLFDLERFEVGSPIDERSPLDMYLSAALALRRGTPAILALIYKSVLDRLGLRNWGVGLMDRILVAVEDGRNDPILVDPSLGGRVCSISDAQGENLLSAESRSDDDGVPHRDVIVHAMSHRNWVTRVLQNLLNVFAMQSRYADVAAMLEMEIALWPMELRLRRDLGLVLARCGHAQHAAAWLDHYLQAEPDDPQRPELEELLAALH